MIIYWFFFLVSQNPQEECVTDNMDFLGNQICKTF
jgi:hypothetical protein